MVVKDRGIWVSSWYLRLPLSYHAGTRNGYQFYRIAALLLTQFFSFLRSAFCLSFLPSFDILWTVVYSTPIAEGSCGKDLARVETKEYGASDPFWKDMEDVERGLRSWAVQSSWFGRVQRRSSVPHNCKTVNRDHGLKMTRQDG